MKSLRFPQPLSEWHWCRPNKVKIKCKVVLVDEAEDAIKIRPVSEEEYRLTEAEKEMRSLSVHDFYREYAMIEGAVSFTNVQVHEFCLTTYVAKRLPKYVVGQTTLNFVTLARDFMFQHAIDDRADLMPLAVDCVREWWNKWETKQEFLTNLKNKHES